MPKRSSDWPESSSDDDFVSRINRIDSMTTTTTTRKKKSKRSSEVDWPESSSDDDFVSRIESNRASQSRIDSKTTTKTTRKKKRQWPTSDTPGTCLSSKHSQGDGEGIAKEHTVAMRGEILSDPYSLTELVPVFRSYRRSTQ